MSKIKFERKKKQFRLYDVYRYATTGAMSNIEGIVSYECNKDASVLVVRFEDYTGEYKDGIARNFFCKNEFELKQTIKQINKQLGNCMTPGPRRCK